MSKETDRLAAALDAIEKLPGLDDLEDHPTDSIPVDQSVHDALMDVLYGVRMAADGTRSASGINHYILHGIPVPVIRLIGWQDRLKKALEKLN